VESAERSGNKRVNDIYEALLRENTSGIKALKPIAGSHAASRLRFIREKYFECRYYSEDAHAYHVYNDAALFAAHSSPSNSVSRRSLRSLISSRRNGGIQPGTETSVVSGSGQRSVETISTSPSSQDERSTDNPGSTKDGYRHPRRTEFLNSRSNLNFSMEDVEEDDPKPVKKGPVPIKIVVAVSAAAPASSRVAMYSRTSKLRERGRSSSQQRSSSTSTKPATPTASRPRSSSIRGLLEKRESRRNRSSSQTPHQSLRTKSRSPARSARRTPSPTRPSASSSRQRTPSSPNRSRNYKTPARPSTSRSPGRAGISRSSSDQDLMGPASTASPKRLRVFIAPGRSSLIRLRSDRDFTENERTSVASPKMSRRSIARAEMGGSSELKGQQTPDDGRLISSQRRGLSRNRTSDGTRARSSSRTQRNGEKALSRQRSSPDRGSEGRQLQGRTRSASRDPTEDDRLRKRSDKDESHQRASQGARRERSRSRPRTPKEMRPQNQSESRSKTQEDPVVEQEVPIRVKIRAHQAAGHSNLVSASSDHTSRSDNGEPVTTRKYGGKATDNLGRSSFHSSDGSRRKRDKLGRNSYHGIESPAIMLVKGNRSLSAIANGVSFTAKLNPTRVSLGAKYGKDASAIPSETSYLKGGEENFAVVSSGKKTLDSFRAEPRKCMGEDSFRTRFHDGFSVADDDHSRVKGGGNSFETKNLRLRKFEVDEKQSERAQRKSSIFAALDMMEANPDAEEQLMRSTGVGSRRRFSFDGDIDDLDHNHANGRQSSSRVQRRQRRQNDTAVYTPTHQNDTTTNINNNNRNVGLKMDFNKGLDGLTTMRTQQQHSLPRRRLYRKSNLENRFSTTTRGLSSSNRDLNHEDGDDDDNEVDGGWGRDHYSRLANFEKSFVSHDVTV
jgi:hypothetical protein